jgi:hypothetical protein
MTINNYFSQINKKSSQIIKYNIDYKLVDKREKLYLAIACISVCSKLEEGYGN